MEIPTEWLVEAGLQNFRPQRSAFRCAVPHQLIALAEIEPHVRPFPLDANGFGRTRMISVLEMLRDDRPCDKPIEVVRQAAQWPYRLYDGVHRFYACRTLGFTHVPAVIFLGRTDVTDPAPASADPNAGVSGRG
jgi:hypothetical protein